jgi:outer membrane protein OmpA-like peptidoglycan-associated protein
MFKRTAVALSLVLAPAPAFASGPWLIHFGLNEANLTAENELIVAFAAEWLRTNGSKRLIVEAGADRVGSRSYNLELSRRRALSIRSAFVRRGFPEGQIEIRAMGESRPLTQTPDGVAERDNRYGMFFPEEWGRQ